MIEARLQIACPVRGGKTCRVPRICQDGSCRLQGVVDDIKRQLLLGGFLEDERVGVIETLWRGRHVP